MAERILVTGGSGFIGSHLVEALLGRGAQVVNLDLREERTPTGAVQVRGDICDPAALARAVEGCGAVCHLAALVGVADCIRREEEVVRCNFAGVEAVVRACEAAGVERLLFASSSEVYGEGSPGGRLREDGPTRPLSVYGRTKLEAEALIRDFGQHTGAQATCLRYCNIYGPRQREEFVVPILLRQALEGKPLTICGDGSQVRCYTYVDDAVRGTLAALDRPERDFQVFNICSERPLTTLELAGEVLARCGGGRVRHVSYGELGREEAVEILCRIPSGEKAAALLGFRAQVPLRPGLAKTAEYYRKTAGS